MNANEWAILNKKALVTVRLSLTPQVALIIFKEKTTAVVMQALEKLFEKPSASNKVFLMKRLFNMKMFENGSIADHLINDFNGVTYQLESVSINDDDEFMVLLFLCSLPDSWNNLVTTLSNSTVSEMLTLNDVMSSIINDKMRRKTISDGISSSTALSLESRGIKKIQLDFCKGCVYGKQKRVNFRSDGKEKKIERLELVHTVVCGPTTVKSLGGNKVKCLKSDNGGEYRDEGFQEYCSNNVIRLIRTLNRTPQENGLTKRMNRTIMERARCMMIYVDLPLQFWAVDIDTAVYLINRSPASALHGGIPEEEWIGKPVNYSFLRIFGCIAYTHIDKEEMKKLDSKSPKCVFIRYRGDEYGYHLWDYEHKKIIRSRDAIFDESQLYKHRLQEHGIEKENRKCMELDEP
ncbi:hypothetical protein RJ640_007666 [Escallonia rubra]|uniref:Integrase catalytic domain-containing protein n=1 Tax=Escallonia rubra TaxID=112253 RepID=A0AA88UB38_9ASTE|nr:hypothetical protein RJ640_007666 [Escallonia rubra]